MVSVNEAVHESLVDEGWEEAGLSYRMLVRGFVRWKLGYILSPTTICPQFLNGSNEADR